MMLPTQIKVRGLEMLAKLGRAVELANNKHLGSGILRNIRMHHSHRAWIERYSFDLPI